MKIRIPLSLAILIPVATTILAVVGLTMVLSASSNIATVEKTLRDRQKEMIQVLTAQFAGSVKFGKMEAVEASFAGYKADPDFGLAAAGAVNAAGAPILKFGDNQTLVDQGIALAVEATKTDTLATLSSGDFHLAAYPAHFGKENELVGAVVMTWDLSIHRGAIISQQLLNGLIGLGIAAAGMVALAVLLMLYVTKPLQNLTQVSTRLAKGELEAEIRGAQRKDELGDLARAVEVFRDNSLKVRNMTAAEAARIISDQEARQVMMKELQSAFGEVVDAAIAGDFSRRVGAQFPDAELNSLAGSVNSL
ncbi:MAG: HAMP domain-containing protein, partial [Devosia sp.]